MSKQPNLGRGLDGLLPADFDNSVLLDSGERVQQIKLTQIHPNADQPRKRFDDSALRELADSIMQHGVLQPTLFPYTTLFRSDRKSVV